MFFYILKRRLGVKREPFCICPVCVFFFFFFWKRCGEVGWVGVAGEGAYDDVDRLLQALSWTLEFLQRLFFRREAEDFIQLLHGHGHLRGEVFTSAE